MVTGCGRILSSVADTYWIVWKAEFERRPLERSCRQFISIASEEHCGGIRSVDNNGSIRYCLTCAQKLGIVW